MAVSSALHAEPERAAVPSRSAVQMNCCVGKHEKMLASVMRRWEWRRLLLAIKIWRSQ